ncbi:MAG TPA: dihydroxyacetone kinase subunit DhaK [Candidatus Limnocylindrales bacterium]|jgi:dihydroxyacetone kinase-like protein|nr:dihydroxyacetone kinase subunit DhaK [Candidatus Limnocylindrales bacterium]
MAVMQKILNDPEPFVDEMLEGILAAHPGQLRRPSPRAVVRADAPVPGKVAIATGGGSGHLPVFMGYVGDGVIDGAAIGNVFASPSSDDMLEVTRAISGGAGVLYLYGNYGGDRLNFDLAAELAADEGIEVRTILGADDVASAPRERAASRRGIAGIFFLYKVAGAAAAAGMSLDEVVAVTERAAARTRTMGVALSPCTIPAAGVPTFELPVGQMEIGMGIHGEPGVRRGPLATANEIAAELMRSILADLPYGRGDDVAVLVNGLGATPKEELYILYRAVSKILDGEGIRVHRVWVGEYATSLEMAGASVTLLRLDDELKRLVDAPANTPFFVQA